MGCIKKLQDIHLLNRFMQNLIRPFSACRHIFLTWNDTFRVTLSSFYKNNDLEQDP